MKRTLCLLLGLFAGSAAAAPASTWIEYHYAELDREWPSAPYDEGEGTEHGLAAAYATSSTVYWRADIRRQRHEADIRPLVVGDEAAPGVFVAPNTEFDLDGWRVTEERNIETVSAGVRSPLNSGVDLIGELGVARIGLETTSLALHLDSSGTGLERLAFQTRSTEQTGALGRLGLVVEDGNIAWGATMEWFNKMPTGFLEETDSARWWNAYLGYRFSPNLSVHLRYADTEQYSAKGLSLRWTL